MALNKQQLDQLKDAYPLTRLQAGMLFHSEYNPGTAIYHDVVSLHLQGHFDLASLKTAVQELVARHPILRTSFDFYNFSEPMQLVWQTVDIPIQVEDLRHLSQAEQENTINAWLAAEKNQHFDWEAASLLHIYLHRRSEEAFQFTLSHHHALLDGWSATILLTELFQLYIAHQAGKEPALKPPPQTLYRDFVALEKEAIQSESCRAYWQHQLSDCAVTRIPRQPAAASAPVAEDERVRQQTHLLSPEVSQALKQLAHTLGVPLKTVLLTAHLKLLSFLSGQTDVLTGLVSHGRPETPDGDRVLGLFLNTLPFRSQLATGTWAELVQKTFAAEQALLPFRWYPLAELQQFTGGQPLFETAFNFVHFHALENLSQFGDIRVLEAQAASETNFTLAANFQIPLSSPQIQLRLDYRISELDAEQMRAIKGYYLRILTAMAHEPHGHHETFSPLTPEEQHQMLVAWNDTQAPYPQEQCIHELFEVQVIKTPEAIAVTYEDQQLTYRQLNQRANRLAYYLQKLGVGPEVLVGICMERSIEMLVGILGILKAGGAYVPLDPTYPQERLRFICRDTDLQIILVTAGTAHIWQDARNNFTLCDINKQIKLDNPPDIQWEVNNLDFHSAQPAYVLYTSGSTGLPKGVLIEHRNVLAMLFAYEKIASAGDDLTGTFVCPFGFDVSVWEIFSCLCFGGKLHILNPDIFTEPRRFADYLAQNQITSAYIPPTLLSTLADELEKRPHPIILSRILVGVEPIQQLTLQRFRQLFDQLCIINGYGPTEATICSTFYNFQTAFSLNNPAPIGTALLNYQVYVADRNFQPLPVLVAGEILISGSGLGRGYLNNPRTTAERFIPNPYGAVGTRLYRSGDLARWLPDGNLEFLGRIDHQVKLRGFRVELGEIEASLTQHPAVQKAVAHVREKAEHKHLLAYVVPSDTAVPEPELPSTLHRFLQEKLPEYMIPSAFVIIDKLPLTANGKINRNALPAPNRLELGLEQPFVAPRTPFEEMLATIWARILDVEQVGIYDNFFNLGGNSLSASQVISRMRGLFQADLPLRQLFENPNVASLATHIETAKKAGHDLALPPIQPLSRNGHIPLSFAQQRLWFWDQFEPGGFTYNIPMAVSLNGRLNIAALQQAFHEIISRHEVLRTTFQAVGGQPVQVIAPARSLGLPVIDLRALPQAKRKAEAQRLTTAERQHPFDLTQDLLLRTSLLQLDAEAYIALLTMHHIVGDGWSTGVLIQELSTLYQANLSGKPSPLPELPIQYADFAQWQRHWLQGDLLKKQLDYWRQQLADIPTGLELPTDRQRPPIKTFGSAEHSFLLSEPVTTTLKKLCQHEGTTLFMLLLAAFKVLLYRYTGQGDMIIGSPIANRNRPEIEGLIGFFVNTLVLRTNLSDDPRFHELLGRVREITLAAYAHQDLPFEKLVEELAPERELSRSPLFQVMFALQNMPMGELSLPGMTLNQLPVDNVTAKFDLMLSMTETKAGLGGVFIYNTDLFEAHTIERMTTHFQTLLKGIGRDATTRISNLPLLMESERHQLIATWNDTRTDYPRAENIATLFESQVNKTADAIAAVYEGHYLTYRELNRRANQLGHYLQAQGVGPEVLVGIFVERSLDMLVGLLGILKAGGAYVPLDLTYPQDRLSFMVADAQVPLLLTQQAFADNLPEHNAKIIFLDTDWETISQESEQNPISGTTAENSVYVMYSSGSTGKPKGITIRHRGINRLIFNTNWIELNALDRVAQASNTSFDAATFEMWGALLHGAQLVGISKNIVLSPPTFATQLQEKKITVLYLTTALLNQLAHEIPQAFHSLRYVVFGGEAADPKWLNEIIQNGPPEQLLNMYGPTENTVFASRFAVKEIAPGATSVSVGRPISNTQIYILDRAFHLVPVGMVGEVLIGGDGLAVHYFNRPGLTADRFIPHPFSDEPGARLYRTGDLACYEPDGKMEFLGRVDHQVKIRGFRIELEEVEAFLNQHSAVRDAVALVREDAPGDKRLVAYVVPDQTQKLTTSQLRHFLKEKLPDYMVPSIFIMLDNLPLTPNGKVDRKALPATDGIRPELAQPFVAPRNPVEKTLADIWANALRLEQVGIHDDFFALGGHSLLATQIVAQLREALQVDLPLANLFEKPTIAELAQTIKPEKRHAAEPERPTLQPISRAGHRMKRSALDRGDEAEKQSGI